MQTEISKVLAEQEKQRGCRILFAAESGSRAWGFASADSDYDIRIIYQNPYDWYLKIEERPEDTFAVMLPGDLDLAGWELRKTLRLFYSCNLALYEWLQSPIIYQAESVFHARLRNLIPSYFKPEKAVCHYLSMYRRAMEDLDANKTIRIKKLFYALRAILAAAWSGLRQSMPPTEFSRLLESDLVMPELRTLIIELQQQKQNTGEAARVALPLPLADFIADWDAQLTTLAPTLSNQLTGADPLDRLLLDCVSERME